MKNLKVNDIFKKIIKKTRLVLLTTSIVVGLAGCTNEELSDKSTTSNKVEISHNEEPTLDLSYPDSIGDAYYMEFYDSENGGKDKKEKQRGYVREVTKNEKKYLVDSSDYNKVLISDYIEIGEPYMLEYYNRKDKSDSPSYVIDVRKEDHVEVVDAKNFGVLFSNLDYIDVKSQHVLDYAEYMYYYDSKNGGKDNDGYGNGYVYEVTSTDEKKHLLDASSLQILLYGYDKRYDEEYMEYYDSENGGKDNDSKKESGYGNGKVFEVESDGMKSLIDASHIRILLSNYDEMSDAFSVDGYEEIDTDNRGAGYVQEIVKYGKHYLVDANDWEFILLEEGYHCNGKIGYFDSDRVMHDVSGSELKGKKSKVLTKD